MDGRSSRRTRQFGILQIAVLTALVALICVPVGSFFRSLPLEDRPRAIAGMLVCLVLAAAGIVFTIWRRIQVERIAGTPHVSISTATTATYHVMNVISCVAFLVFVGLCLYGYTTKAGWSFFSPVNLVLNGSIWGVATATYLTMMWCGVDPTQIEFCENGLIQKGIHVARWSEYRAYRWGKIDSNELFLLNDGDFIQFKVPPDSQAAVVQHLAKVKLEESPDWA